MEAELKLLTAQFAGEAMQAQIERFVTLRAQHPHVSVHLAGNNKARCCVMYANRFGKRVALRFLGFGSSPRM